MDNKTDLRLRAKSIRKTLDIARLSENASEKIRQTELYKNVKNVLIFYPMRYEINLLELLKDNKNFYLPKVCGIPPINSVGNNLPRNSLHTRILLQTIPDSSALKMMCVRY